MNATITRTIGCQHFRIKPYAILILDCISSQKQEVIFIKGADVFEKTAEGYQWELDRVFDFNASDVVVTDQMMETIQAKGLKLGGVAAKRYEANQKGLSISEFGVVRRYVEEGISVTDTDTSECPAFKRYWDPEAVECQQCKAHFPDEYAACKKACEKKEKGKQSEEEPEATAPTETKKAVESTKAEKGFKGFRKGSRADILINHLEDVQKTTIPEAAEFLSKAADVSMQKSLETVKGYLYEWKRGQWSGKAVAFPFSIHVDGETINYIKE